MAPIRQPALIFLLNSLSIGGAERPALALAGALADSFRVLVVALKPAAPGAPTVQPGEAVRTECLHVRHRFDARAAARLADLVEREGCEAIACVNTYPLVYAHWARRRCARALRLVEIFHTTALWTWKDRLQMLFYRPLFRR